jgi:hypothetical protein
MHGEGMMNRLLSAVWLSAISLPIVSVAFAQQPFDSEERRAIDQGMMFDELEHRSRFLQNVPQHELRNEGTINPEMKLEGTLEWPRAERPAPKSQP